MIEWIVGGILLLGAGGKKSAAEAQQTAPPLQQNTNPVILTTDRKENSYANVRHLLPFVRKLHQSQTAADEQHECFIMQQLPYQV